MCDLQTIQYDPNYEDLKNQKIPPSTFTYLKDNKIVKDDFLKGISTMKELEEYINNKIAEYNDDADDDSLFDIFCLIHIWGGFRGLTAFRCNKPFREKWENSIKEQYRLLVKTCLGIIVDKDAPLNICKNDIDTVLNAVQTIKDNVSGLGVSFITKHTRFWLQRNNEKNPLPIFDNIMANGLLNSAADITLLKQYWNCMIEKAVSIPEMSLLSLERQLFNIFREKRHINDSTIPTRWRNDLIDDGEWIELNEIHTLLFVGHNSNGEYYCEVNYMEDIGVDIYSQLQLVLGGTDILNLPWKYRNPQYRYVLFGAGEENKEKAQRLKKQISDIVRKSNNATSK